MNLGLEERFAASDLDERTVELHYSAKHRIDGHRLAFDKCMWSIAPDTTLSADRSSDKYARQAGKSRFPLNAPVDLVDQKGARGIGFEQFEPMGRVRDGHGGYLSASEPEA
jgi:hypothetical protein